MSKPTFCYWSVADGEYADMMTCCIHSARQVGVQQDFHVFSDRKIPGASVQPAGKFSKSLYLFKFSFLKEVANLDYDYFVFLDADNYFVRHPGNLLNQLQGAPVHIVLESNCAAENNVRRDWWDCPLENYVELMKTAGVRSRSIFNTNAGFWIVHRNAVERVCQLADEFWQYAKRQGYIFTEEAPLAYVGHMLMGNPYRHTLNANRDVWASDWAGHFQGRLPANEKWNFIDYMSETQYEVNPCIVHAMRSKQMMIDAALRL